MFSNPSSIEKDKDSIGVNCVSTPPSVVNSLQETRDEDLSTWQLVLRYRKAVLWSAFLALGGLNWGLDNLLGSGVVAVPSFKRDFGYDYHDTYIVSFSWQIAFNTSAYVGTIFGAIASGYLADRIGKRSTLGCGCLLSIAAVFLQVFATSGVVLLVGKAINGLSLGAFLTVPSAYAAEICPCQIRGFTTSGVQLSLGVGQLVANLIIKATGTSSSRSAYRIPFALQFFLPVVLLIGLPFSPESPWFLLRAHKPEKAHNTLARLGYKVPETVLAVMSKTIAMEDKNAASTTYLDCFRGTDLRRTEISIGITAVAQLTGVVFVIGYSSYFFELAGLSTSSSFSLSIGVSVLGLVGVVCSWFLINRAGRRSMSIYGVTGLTILLFIIAILDILPSTRHGATRPVYGQVACIIAFAFVYLLTIGPVYWTLYAEIASSRLRSRTVGLGIVTQSLFGILMNIVIPLLINPDAAHLRGKIGFIFGGTAFASLIWTFYRVPETTGRSLEQLDFLFEHKIPARKFKEYVFS